MSEPARKDMLGHSPAVKAEREQRREQVAVLVLSRVPYRQIAERVGCSYSTVRADIEVVKRGWRDRYAESYEAHVAEQTATLDALRRAWLPRALGGTPDVKAAEVVLRIEERRARLFGTDKPARVEHSGQIEVLDELVAEGEDAIAEIERRHLRAV